MNDQEDRRRETSADRLVYFAAERTLLTWIRAGLGLMALGFVVDRFELILRETRKHALGYDSVDAFSSWIGILLILVGVAANLTAAIRYIRFEIHYHRDTDTRPGYGLSLGVFLTLIVSVLGLILVFFLYLAME